MKNRLVVLGAILTLVILAASFSGCHIMGMVDFEGEGTEYYWPSDPEVDGADEYEVDNSYSQATAISATESQYHTIHEEGDVDYIKFEAVSGRVYKIRLSEIKGFEPQVTLFDTDGTTQIEMKNTGTYTGTFDWWGYDKDRNYDPDQKEAIVYRATQNGTFYVEVKDIYDAHNQGSYKIAVGEIIVIDDVTDLTATPNSPELAIDLSWTSVSGVAGYRIYRTDVAQILSAPNYSDFTLLATNDTAVTYRDSNVLIDTTYYYYVVPFVPVKDGNPSNVDDAALTVTVNTTNTLTATANSIDFQIDVDWSEIAGVQGYYLYRTDVTQNLASPNYSDFTRITTINNPAVTAYVDTNIEPNTTYYYYVTGFVLNKEGNPSNVDDAMFDWGAFKPSSAFIRASEGLSGYVRITLEDKYANSNIIKYELHRSNDQYTAPDTFIGEFASTAAIGSYIDDSSVTPGIYYNYCIRIVIDINGIPTASDYSYYDSGTAAN